VHTFALRVVAAPFALVLAVLVALHLGAAWLHDVQRFGAGTSRPENPHA
jgi:hypothetical protein